MRCNPDTEPVWRFESSSRSQVAHDNPYTGYILARIMGFWVLTVVPEGTQNNSLVSPLAQW